MIRNLSFIVWMTVFMSGFLAIMLLLGHFEPGSAAGLTIGVAYTAMMDLVCEWIIDNVGDADDR